MKYDKPFKTLDEQLTILKERKLQIPDDDLAKELILLASYYDLVNGYKPLFMPSDTFKPDISIEQLFVFSFIDKTVQSLVVKYSLMVEITLKTKLSYVLSKNIGVHQKDYLCPRHYKQKIRGLTFDAVKTEIMKQLNPNTAKHPTKHYLKNHNHVPPWILFKNISFGAAINIFRFMCSENKAEVANLLIPSDIISTKDKIDLISKALDSIRRFRNQAAHSLNFVSCRNPYDLPGHTYYLLFPKGIVRRYRKDTSAADKLALKGLYGVLLSMFLFLNNEVLQNGIVKEYYDVLVNEDDMGEVLSRLKRSYVKISDLPKNFSQRLAKLEQKNI